MTLDHAVFGFAGLMTLLSAILIWLIVVVAAADRFRWGQYDAVQHQRILSGGPRLQGVRRR